MSDADRRDLQRRARQGDGSAVARLQKLHDRIGLSGDDADYLLRYLTICDEFCGRGYHMGDGGSINYAEAKKLLDELNEEFKLRVGSKTLRTTFPAEGLARSTGYGPIPDSEAWMPSTLCGYR